VTSTARRSRRELGFSFVEILVVMGIIAVLVGIGIGVYAMVIKKTPVFKTKSQVGALATAIEAWKRQWKGYPPSDLNRLGLVMGTQLTLKGRLNTNNTGIEALYQALYVVGVDFNADVSPSSLANTDDDRLEKAITKDGNGYLFEIVDAWGNPFVYFVDADYVTAEKTPPTYVLGEEGDGGNVEPKPWRASTTQGFANPGGFQLFSMGPDGVPNTEDDITSWER
jgi:type II secretory pathway pseudopilin PulG